MQEMEFKDICGENKITLPSFPFDKKPMYTMVVLFYLFIYFIFVSAVIVLYLLRER